MLQNSLNGHEQIKSSILFTEWNKKKKQQQSQLILYPNEHLGWNKTKISFTANTTEITGIIFFLYLLQLIYGAYNSPLKILSMSSIGFSFVKFSIIATESEKKEII